MTHRAPPAARDNDRHSEAVIRWIAINGMLRRITRDNPPDANSAVTSLGPDQHLKMLIEPSFSSGHAAVPAVLAFGAALVASPASTPMQNLD